MDTALSATGIFARARARVRRLRRPLLALAVLAVAALAFEAMRAMPGEVRYHDLRQAIALVETPRILLACLLTAGSYLALTLYDWLALRTIGRDLPWRTAAIASFTSYALSYSLGFALLTGGTARLRAYSAAGLDFADVARITIIASATFWAGIVTVATVALLFAHANLSAGPLEIGPTAQHLLGAALLVILAAAVALRGRRGARLHLGGHTVPLPPAYLLCAQLATSVIDLACAAGALYVLIPGAPPGLFGGFVLAYAAALVAGLVSHVPGGLGVFEAVILALVPLGHSGLFAALLLYRMIYYLLPLSAAGTMLVVLEGRRLRKPLLAGLGAAGRVGQALAPPLLAILVFGGGLVLLMSGALPPLHGRMAMLRDVLPLPFVDASHFAASLVGTALLLVAPAIQTRLESGFHAARALLLAGAIFSLSKGIDFEEAGVLLAVAGLLQYARPTFYRRSGIGSAPVEHWWWAAALIALALSAWAGFFAYKHIPYSDALWWDFAWRGDAPRFLRATLGATMLVAGWAFWRILSAAPVTERSATLPAETAAIAFAAAGRSDALLAFTGDKNFLVSAAGDAFLMYRVQGRTWITMGDPVGPLAAWPELVWELRRRCDASRGRLCLYEVSAEMLPLIVELGLQPMKYGEEALIDLTKGFDLQGSQFKSLRHSVNKAVAAGLLFEVIPAREVPNHLETLRGVSNAWLAGKKGKEKGFSLGRFDEEYLSRFDCAVLRLDGRTVAFANIWALPNREEMSVDLMRHLPDTPYGAMDLLFVRLLQLGAERGFRDFSLGMAPLSGLHGGALAPLWSRLGAAVYGRGEQLYGFSGLRAFKSKFAPRWIPRYIGVSPGLSMPRAIVDLAQLVGG
ncbi:bifunctional lysylphosphatidylglycerol flippase/synthetase MprF [Sphingomonas psychrotolerans]|uniref:Phosphatidylglycerol lysyltransferase n=1 Tax=Sphingomonas psychrotolerans TaxID=1327635 RepID=A0ABU3N571_9SPHN|nr:bifunctional lysylphosphatidylglycerol flippase/synthetase MprF [Sphingomonas psychrotolerans]MDT8758465.1 bifunctional lysylphosphatidylglycerol flippase/synthetase MprF [Sphingomonas psychrotolerans]